MCTYTSWSQDVTAADLHQVLETLCLWELLPFTGSDGPADKLLDLVLSNDIAGVLSFSVDYNLPFTCEYFAALRQVLALFQKRSDLTITGVDPKQVAKDKFLEAESLCRETNAILKMRREGLIQFESRVSVSSDAPSRKSPISLEEPFRSSLSFACGSVQGQRQLYQKEWRPLELNSAIRSPVVLNCFPLRLP